MSYEKWWPFFSKILLHYFDDEVKRGVRERKCEPSHLSKRSNAPVMLYSRLAGSVKFVVNETNEFVLWNSFCVCISPLLIDQTNAVTPPPKYPTFLALSATATKLLMLTILSTCLLTATAHRSTLLQNIKYCKLKIRGAVSESPESGF